MGWLIGRTAETAQPSFPLGHDILLQPFRRGEVIESPGCLTSSLPSLRLTGLLPEVAEAPTYLPVDDHIGRPYGRGNMVHALIPERTKPVPVALGWERGSPR